MEDEVGKMCTRLLRELKLHFKLLDKIGGLGALLEDQAGKMGTILLQELDLDFDILKNCHIPSAFGR